MCCKKDPRLKVLAKKYFLDVLVLGTVLEQRDELSIDFHKIKLYSKNSKEHIVVEMKTDNFRYHPISHINPGVSLYIKTTFYKDFEKKKSVSFSDYESYEYQFSKKIRMRTE